MSRKKPKSKKEKAAERFKAGKPSKYAAKHGATKASKQDWNLEDIDIDDGYQFQK